MGRGGESTARCSFLSLAIHMYAVSVFYGGGFGYIYIYIYIVCWKERNNTAW